MLSNPSAHPIPQFAAQRVRGAEAVVEQSHRRPVKVIRMVFFMLTFSERGVLDADALMRQAAAALDTVHPQTRSLRISNPDAYYHVTCRGNDRRAVFRDDQDRRRHL